ncbi:MAG: ferritin-like domain-containing protein [Marmoricola sp.]
MTPVQALQKALAAEHAAVHLYGLLGGQSSKSRQPTLFGRLEQTYEAHRASRDRLTVLVTVKGADPVAARVDYEVPGPTSTPTQIQAVARTIERRVTRTYGQLVANTAAGDRRWAISALDASALREVSFGAEPTNFPGLSSP